MVDDQITLLRAEYHRDAVGNDIKTLIDGDTIYAKMLSVSQREVQSVQSGLCPQLVAVVWYCEYNNERYVKYKEEIYDIYRTYKIGEKIELYLSRGIE